MSWEVVPDSEVPKVLAATREGRCVSCYGEVSKACPEGHDFYCCQCDDTDCLTAAAP